jgi:hypothetical protein
MSLFNDIADVSLRNRNRAVIMANMSEQFTKGNKISPKGAGLILGYFNEVPLEERKDVQERYETEMKARGYGRN